ncbi:MAG: ABC transporter ATP-binding protein [Clostridia bacterium]|nr:ABC transporter ATP-binding protein [Clostridia bacterium]
MNLYEIKNLVKVYGEKENKVHALNGVSINIPRGKFVVVLGASGSGKSTLLNILGGMDTPTEGEIFFDGENISKHTQSKLTKFRKENIGYVFQSYNLLPNLTALENVEFSTEIGKLPKDGAKNALTMVGLFERKDHYPAELSGGEQQRISIARAIAKKPKVLLCDEPTGALDYKTGIMILNVLCDINKKQSTSIILITHSQDIAKIADVVIKMRSGKIIDVFENPAPQSPNEVEW